MLLGGPGGSVGAETGFPIGAPPSAVASGDFNGDADPDLAVANFGSDTVSVLLGEAGGGFGGQTSIPTGDGPGRVAFGDFNSDGDLDLVVPNQFSNTVDVRLGGPGGSFGPQITIPVRQSPQSVAVGDFDRDGDPDLAVSAGSRTVSVFLNTGAWHAALDRASISFPSTPLGEESDRRTVVLTNIGSTDLSVSEVEITGTDASGFVVSDDTCSGATLTPGDTCSVRTRFRPARVGSHSASLEFTDNAQDSPQSVALSATGRAPVTLNPTTIVWKPRPDSTVGTYRTVTLTNRLGRALTVAAVTLAGADASSFRLPDPYDECTSTTVPAGGTCEVKVRFRPDGVGPKTANLAFTDDAVTSPQTVGLSGTGAPGAWLTLSRQALKFGHVQVGTTTAPMAVTLTNTGSAAMKINSITLEGDDPGDFVGLAETCTTLSSLGPDESCSASIAFRPSVTGQRRARLAIDSTAPRSPQHIQLRGTGT